MFTLPRNVVSRLNPCQSRSAKKIRNFAGIRTTAAMTASH